MFDRNSAQPDSKAVLKLQHFLEKFVSQTGKRYEAMGFSLGSVFTCDSPSSLSAAVNGRMRR